MTVNTLGITSGPYVGNDVADNFAYTFRIENKNQLKVYQRDIATDVSTLLTVDTDYTVAGLGIDGGGDITLVAGPLATGQEIYIRSNYIETQLTDFDSQGGFFPDVHEAALDKLTFLIQQILDINERSLRFDESFTGSTSTILPNPVANYFLRWKSDLSGLENVFVNTTASSQDDLPIEKFGGGTDKTAAENAAAWELAVLSANGRPIVYGSEVGEGKVYNQNPTSVTVKAVKLIVNGDTTILGAGDPADYLFEIDALSVGVQGPGTIDANNLHSRGVGVINDTTDDGETVIFSGGGRIINCKQHHPLTNPSGPQTTTAAGVQIRGHYRLALAMGFHIDNIWSDAPPADSGGTGNDSARGFQFDYSRNAAIADRRIAEICAVDYCVIKNIYPANDADGVFVQQAPWKFDKLPMGSITNSKFINCQKRAIKGQVGIIKIDNVHVVRDTKVDAAIVGATGTFGTDIDVQYSGGSISNVTCVYKSGLFCPKSVFGVASQKAFENPDTMAVDPLADVADATNFISNVSITVDDDLLGDGFRLFTATGRYDTGSDKVKPLSPVTFDNVNCNKRFDTLGLLFGPATVGATPRIFQQINLRNITCESLEQDYLISATEDSTQPAGADSYGAGIEIDNFVTTSTTQKFYTPFTESVVDNGDNIDVTLNKVNDDTPVIGKTYHKIEGRALNGDALSFDIINTQNDLVKVTATYVRASSGATQVRNKQVITFIDSSSSGRRQIDRHTEYTDEQAGLWDISGDWNRNNSDGYHVTRLTKAAGTDTDGLGANNGWWAIEVESQSPVFVYTSSDAEGTQATELELKDSSISGSDYYPVFDDENLRTISSALALTQVGQETERIYLFTATTSADLPPTAQLRIGDRVKFAVVEGFTGTINVDDSGTETIEVGAASATSYALDNSTVIITVIYEGSSKWAVRGVASDGGANVGVLNSSGTGLRLPTGWSSSKISTGRYRVTFDVARANTNYVAIPTCNSSSARNATLASKTTTTFDIFTRDDAGSLVDTACEFTQTD